MSHFILINKNNIIPPQSEVRDCLYSANSLYKALTLVK